MSDRADKDDNVFGKGLYETRRLARAVIERWPISPELRRGAIARLQQVVADKTSSRREVTAAIRALISADAQNIEAEREAQPQIHLHQHEHKEAIDYSKIPQEHLDRIEKELLELSSGTTSETAGGTVQAEPLPLHENGMAAD